MRFDGGKDVGLFVGCFVQLFVGKQTKGWEDEEKKCVRGVGVPLVSELVCADS